MTGLLKRLALCLYLLALALTLTACTIPGTKIDLALPSLPDWVPLLGGAKRGGPVTLTYWGLWEPPAVIQPLIDEYQAQHPNITIVYEERDPRQHLTTVKARLKTETPPDIIRVHSTWVPFLYPDLAPLPEGVMKTAQYEQIFFPVAKNLLAFDKKYYGLPLEVDGLALIYNLDLLQKANFNAPPANWNELRNYARALTKKDEKGQVTQAGVALGYSNIDYFSDIIGLMFSQNGVSFVNKEGKVNFHQSIADDGRNLGAEALTFYTLFATSEKAYNPNWPNSTKAFAQGKVAMILVPSHRILEILGANPQLKLAVAPAPQLPGAEFGSGREVNWANFWAEVVAKNSPHPKKAWEFVKFLSEKESLTTLYKNALQVRPLGEPFARSDMLSAAQIDQFTKTYVEQGPSYTSWNFTFGTYDKILNDAIVQILQEMVDNISLEGKSVEKELNNAAKQVQKVLDKQTAGAKTGR